MDADGCCGFNVSKYRRDGIWGGWVELHKGSNSGDKTYGMGLKNKKKTKRRREIAKMRLFYWAIEKAFSWVDLSVDVC